MNFISFPPYCFFLLRGGNMPLHVDPYRKRIMVDFHMLVDTDIGCALYLQRHAKNRKIFQEHIPQVNIFYLQFMALTRKEENPIAYMFVDEFRENADNIYMQLIKEKWNSVLNCSPTTDILKILYSGYKQNGFKITINCKNEEEIDRIKMLTKDWVSEINIKDTSPFFCLYLHDLTSIVKNNYDIMGKSVYLYNYSKNHFNDDMSNNNNDINQIAIQWIDTTIFKFITPYSKFEMPVG